MVREGPKITDVLSIRTFYFINQKKCQKNRNFQFKITLKEQNPASPSVIQFSSKNIPQIKSQKYSPNCSTIHKSQKLVNFKKKEKRKNRQDKMIKYFSNIY